METREGKLIEMPTDDDDCAAWVMDQNRNVRFISSEELAKMPEFVTETINVGCLAVEGGLMVSHSLDQLFDGTALVLDLPVGHDVETEPSPWRKTVAEDYSTGWITLGSVADFDVATFIRAVHELSSAQGLGFLADKPGPLPDSEIQPFLNLLAQYGHAHMDYIAGRSAKMSIDMHDGHYFILDKAWYDHTDGEFNELLARFGITRGNKQTHGPSCQCDDCKPDHPLRDPEQAIGLCGLSREASPEVQLKNGSAELRSLDGDAQRLVQE